MIDPMIIEDQDIRQPKLRLIREIEGLSLLYKAALMRFYLQNTNYFVKPKDTSLEIYEEIR